MRTHAIVKEQMGHRDIGNIGLHIAPAIGRHLKGQTPHQAQDHGHVMGGKTPENVFLPAHLAEADAIGIDIVHFAQDALLDQRIQAAEWPDGIRGRAPP